MRLVDSTGRLEVNEESQLSNTLTVSALFILSTPYHAAFKGASNGADCLLCCGVEGGTPTTSWPVKVRGLRAVRCQQRMRYDRSPMIILLSLIY
ncbi:hypothetical protein BDW59DRAFT_78120 [Aspergillus cavernicola]|uniref:Uncharacterized protein n=1 Tax=Aspergillus cavernicola TaxID=176166 RepID=A0ABR4J2N4_9EURO